VVSSERRRRRRRRRRDRQSIINVPFPVRKKERKKKATWVVVFDEKKEGKRHGEKTKLPQTERKLRLREQREERRTADGLSRGRKPTAEKEEEPSKERKESTTFYLRLVRVAESQSSPS